MSRLLKSLLSPTSSAPPRPAGLPPGGAPRSSYSAQIGFTSLRLDRPRHPVNTRDSCPSPPCPPPGTPGRRNGTKIKCRAWRRGAGEKSSRCASKKPHAVRRGCLQSTARRISRASPPSPSTFDRPSSTSFVQRDPARDRPPPISSAIFRARSLPRSLALPLSEIPRVGWERSTLGPIIIVTPRFFARAICLSAALTFARERARTMKQRRIVSFPYI